MPIKIFAAIAAAALVIAFVSPVVIKLKEVGLGVIILIGVTMMLVDLGKSLQSKDD